MLRSVAYVLNNVYDYCCSINHFLQNLCLNQFNDRILFIKCIDHIHNEEKNTYTTAYLFPIVGFGFSYMPFRIDDQEKLSYLYHVYCVKNNKLSQYVMSNASLNHVYNRYQSFTSVDEKEISKDYIYAEIANTDITKKIKPLLWSISRDKFRTIDVKRILGMKVDESALELTRESNLMTEIYHNKDKIDLKFD